jgi:hypothetical protein
MIDFLIEFARYFIAVLIAIFYFKILDAPTRIIALQVLIAFGVNIIGYILRLKKINNIPIYNVYLLFDYGLLLLAASKFLKDCVSKRYSTISFGIIIVIWLFEIIRKEPANFVQGTYIVGSFLILIAYLLVFYFAVMKHSQPLWRLPSFWISTAIILFYACNIPNFSMIQYLAYCTKENSFLSGLILDSLNNIRYGFISIGFLIHLYNRTKSLNPHHAR